MKLKTVFCAVFLSILLMPLKALPESKSHWKRGMWVGALSGGVVLGTAFGVWAGVSKKPNNADSDFNGLYGTSGGVIAGIGGAAAGALIGMGIGAAVGSAIPKKDSQQKISIVPAIAPDEYGFSVACSF